MAAKNFNTDEELRKVNSWRMLDFIFPWWFFEPEKNVLRKKISQGQTFWQAKSSLYPIWVKLIIIPALIVGLAVYIVGLFYVFLTM